MQTPAESMPHCLSQNRGSTRLDRLIGELRDRRQQLGETQLSALQTLIDEATKSTSEPSMNSCWPGRNR
jgi:hypothetical protein